LRRFRLTLPALIRLSIASVLRRPRVTRRWVVWTVLALALGLGVIVLSVWMGVRFKGKRDYYFGEKRLETFASVGVLFWSAGVCLAIAVKRVAGTPFAPFWRNAAILFAFLGLDELLQIHENLDRAIHWVFRADPKHPVTDHLDDLIVLSYLFVAVAIAWRHLPRLLQLTAMLQMLCAGAVLTLGMVAMDIVGDDKVIEDGLKLMAGVVIVMGFGAAYEDPLLREIAESDIEGRGFAVTSAL
jgi:hypothetical protein